MFVLKLDDGKHPGRMTIREDFPHATRALGVLERQQGRDNPQIPKKTKRQRPFDEKLRSDLEWQNCCWKVNWSQASSSSPTIWWQSENGMNHNKKNGKISNGGKWVVGSDRFRPTSPL